MKTSANLISSAIGKGYIRNLFLVSLVFVAIGTLNAKPVLPNNNEDKEIRSDWTFLQEFELAYNRVWTTAPRLMMQTQYMHLLWGMVI